MEKISPGFHLYYLTVLGSINAKVPPQKTKLPFKMMENVTLFLKAAEHYGVSGLFLPNDLVNKANIGHVISCLHAVAETVI